MRHFVFRAAPAALYYLLFILFIGFFLFSGKYNAASCKQDCCNGCHRRDNRIYISCLRCCCSVTRFLSWRIVHDDMLDLCSVFDFVSTSMYGFAVFSLFTKPKRESPRDLVSVEMKASCTAGA